MASDYDGSIRVDAAGVAAVEVLADGSLLVVDVGWPRVLRVDRSGKSRVVAREGRGPGEVVKPFAAAVGERDSTYAIYDYARKRVLQFSESNELVRELQSVGQFRLISRLVYGNHDSVLVFAAPSLAKGLREFAIHKLELLRDSIIPIARRSESSPLHAQVQWGVGEVVPLGLSDLLYVEKGPFRFTQIDRNSVELGRTGNVLERVTLPHEAFESTRTEDGRPRERLRPNVRTPLRAFGAPDSGVIVSLRDRDQVHYVKYGRTGSRGWSIAGTRGVWLAAIDVTREQLWFVDQRSENGEVLLCWIGMR